MQKKRQQLKLRGRESQQKKQLPKQRDKELQQKKLLRLQPKPRDKELQKRRQLPRLQLKLKGKDWLKRWPPLSQLLRLKEF